MATNRWGVVVHASTGQELEEGWFDVDGAPAIDETELPHHVARHVGPQAAGGETEVRLVGEFYVKFEKEG